MNKQLLSAAVGALICFSGTLCAQPTTIPSATAPSTAPTTDPERHEVIIPQGFIKVEAADRTALCEPPDKEWIIKALNELQPSARPTTMPSDLADALAAKRDDLIAQMAKDLAITDTTATKKLLTEQVIPDLQKMADIRPPMLYLVCSKKRPDGTGPRWMDRPALSLQPRR